MKKSFYLLLAILLIGISLTAQVELKDVREDQTYIITTHDGATLVGKVLNYNESEILIQTLKLGKISIPTYQLKELKEAQNTDIGKKGEYLKDNLFATRYFLTTNGFDVKKGEHYVLLNWYGPDVQFGIADNLTVGVMSSWLGSPIIGSLKYSKQINENLSFAVGGLAGTLGWADFNVGGALPYASLTLGNRKNNFTVSAGYGAIWTEGLLRDVTGDFLFSGAGMMRLNNSISLVFDSFILPGLSQESNFNALLIPGIRFQKKENFALQFGFAGIVSQYDDYYDETTELTSFAIPMAQVFFKF